MDEFDEPMKQSLNLEKVVEGQDLSHLSEDDLNKRIASLEDEIVRTKQELTRRSSVRDQANALFRTNIK